MTGTFPPIPLKESSSFYDVLSRKLFVENCQKEIHSNLKAQHLLRCGAFSIYNRMVEVGMTNQSAFFRKMAIDGYIIHVDLSDIRSLTKLMGVCSKNLNQYAKRANETGSIYATDIEDLKERFDNIKAGVNMILKQFIKIL